MSETKKHTIKLDRNFLEMDVYQHASGEHHLHVMYLESPTKRTKILVEKYVSQDLLTQAFVNGDLSVTLNARARELVPAIAIRETNNLAALKEHPFEPRDVYCEHCGGRPGEDCDKPESSCLEARADWLRDFLIWLAEQPSTAGEMNKKRVRNVAERMGYDVQNPYDKGPQIVIECPSGDRWGLYVGGRMDTAKSVWMTRGADLSDPERGPFRNELEIALALHALGEEA